MVIQLLHILELQGRKAKKKEKGQLEKDAHSSGLQTNTTQDSNFFLSITEMKTVYHKPSQFQKF